MAKLHGPMFSLDARGQVGKAIVNSIWKGINYARKYVIPFNPKTAWPATIRLPYPVYRQAELGVGKPIDLPLDPIARKIRRSGQPGIGRDHIDFPGDAPEINHPGIGENSALGLEVRIVHREGGVERQAALGIGVAGD